MQGEMEKKCLRLMQKKMGSIEGATTFWGCTVSERRMLQSMILETEENPNKNDFPDLISEGGFIEHFQITSAKETRKGSMHISNEVKHDREFEREVLKKKDVFSGSKAGLEIQKTYNVSGHQHKFLIDSMNKNCTNHLQSFDNYTGLKGTGIFMVQYTDAALEILNCEDETSRHPSGYISYHPHLDKELLKIVQELPEGIEFVIFVFQANSRMAFPYDAKFEVFSKNNLSHLISNLEKENYEISPLNFSITSEYREINAVSYTDS